MATINLGAIKFNWKGAYNSSTSYAVDDVVSSGGNSYVCIQAHSNQAVGNATAYWNIMSAKGTNGTDGTDADLLSIGSTAQGDLYYNSGSAIARLGAGTSGQFLKTQGTGANPVWATNSAVAGTKAFHATTNTTFGLANTTNTEVVFNEEMHDDDGVYNVSNGRYTPGVVGKYFVSADLTINDINGATDDAYLKFFINGNSSGYQYGNSIFSGGGASFTDLHASAVIKITSASDYISTFVYQDGGNNRVAQTYLSGFSGFRIA
jgi:hypothetical protein